MKKNSVLYAIGACIFLNSAFAQAQPARPKLVVGIVVDQMRYDYLYRFYNKYSAKGFKRLLKDGLICENAHYNYVPTYTGPGHASIYTGTTPAYHGIIANDWHNRQSGRKMYCTEDTSVYSIGGSVKAGRMSPKNLLVTTLGDQLKLFTNQRSKVVGLALKDRGAILPAGHISDGAYWFDSETGNWITSSYYKGILPKWVADFNGSKLAEAYLKKQWNTLLPMNQYTESGADEANFEMPFVKGQKTTFPYNLSEINTEWKRLGRPPYDLIRATPFGNSITSLFAQLIIEKEQLGADEYTDLLCVSFSSTDYIGHRFGPASVEVEDTYLRLDKDLADFFTYLDKNVGTSNYVVFLTADHGAAYVPAYMRDLKVPAGLIDERDVEGAVKEFMNQTYGKADWISAYVNQQVYLNHTLINNKDMNLNQVQDELADFLRHYQGVTKAVPAHRLLENDYINNPEAAMDLGYHYVRSGDVLVAFNDGWIEENVTATTHGESYTYDTHVPLIFMGKGISAGSYTERVNITDIAPSLSTMLRISKPSSATGKAIDLYRKK